jgi:hypothetical protein
MIAFFISAQKFAACTSYTLVPTLRMDKVLYIDTNKPEKNSKNNC